LPLPEAFWIVLVSLIEHGLPFGKLEILQDQDNRAEEVEKTDDMSFLIFCKKENNNE
jgi:hypothetical protein